jgi:hypothetical protein
MISKDDLLAQLQTERQQLLKLLDDVPDEALTQPGAIGEWRVIDVLAYIAAWDGESLRRIAYASGESFQPPHDVNDSAYWQAWSEKQIEIKRIMSPRGIKVDMVGTWVRLLAQIEALSPQEYARWLEVDPHSQPDQHQEQLKQLQLWREKWERSLSWWQKLRRKFWRA